MSDSQISEQDVLLCIKDMLHKNGHLNKLKAEVCSQVTQLLQNHQIGGSVSEPPIPTEEVLLVNELIREYLEWNGYLYTASVLNAETGLSQDKKTRLELCSEVGVKDDERSSALPLLSNIVAAYTDRIRKKISKIRNVADNVNAQAN